MLIWRFANTMVSHLVLRRFVILWSSLCLSDSTKHPWAFTTSLIFLRWQLTKLAIYLPPFWKELKSYWPLWYCLFMLQPSVKKGSLPRGCFQYRHATLLKRESRSKHCIWQKMHFKTITQARNDNSNNLFIYSVLFNMLGDQKRITTIKNLKTIKTNIRNIQIYLISKRY